MEEEKIFSISGSDPKLDHLIGLARDISVSSALQYSGCFAIVLSTVRFWQRNHCLSPIRRRDLARYNPKRVRLRVVMRG